MSYEPKWDFKFPTEPPTFFQKFKMEVVRATNNFQCGFDGSLTPLQLGSLKPIRPIREYEVVFAEMLHNNDVMAMLGKLVKDNVKLNREATRKKKLLDLMNE